jgi:hypothetical protein
VGLGLPKYPGEYRLLQIDGVDIHLPCDLETPYPLTIKLRNLFGFKSLQLEGWKVI